MHMSYRYRTSNEYEHITPLFGTLTFISSLYAGWVARSGAISSTHDVGKLPSSDVFFAVTVLLLAIVLLLVFLKIKDIQDEEGNVKNLLSESHIFDLSAILFIILTFMFPIENRHGLFSRKPPSGAKLADAYNAYLISPVLGS